MKDLSPKHILTSLFQKTTGKDGENNIYNLVHELFPDAMLISNTALSTIAQVAYSAGQKDYAISLSDKFLHNKELTEYMGDDVDPTGDHAIKELIQYVEEKDLLVIRPIHLPE